MSEPEPDAKSHDSEDVKRAKSKPKKQRATKKKSDPESAADEVPKTAEELAAIEEAEKQKRIAAGRIFQPSPRTGAWALLRALGRLTLPGGGSDRAPIDAAVAEGRSRICDGKTVTKEQLIASSNKHNDTDTPWEPEEGSACPYSAWSAMTGTLVKKKDLAVRFNTRPPTFRLTRTGERKAIELLELGDDVEATGASDGEERQPPSKEKDTKPKKPKNPKKSKKSQSSDAGDAAGGGGDDSTPKKKKGKEATTRKSRALSERLFLVARDDSDPYEMKFNVLSKHGQPYIITIAAKPKCECADFRIRKGKCKHILFVLLRVLQVPESHPFIADSTKTTLGKAELHSIQANAPNRVADAIMFHPPDTDNHSAHAHADGDSDDEKGVVAMKLSGVDAQCPICFELLAKANPNDPTTGVLLEDVVYCRKRCGQPIHAICFEKWLATKSAVEPPTCALCRSRYPKNPTRKKNGTVEAFSIDKPVAAAAASGAAAAGAEGGGDVKMQTAESSEIKLKSKDTAAAEAEEPKSEEIAAAAGSKKRKADTEINTKRAKREKEI